MQQLQQKPFYTRVALTGVGMFLFLALGLVIPILIFAPGDVVFPIVIAVVALIVGAVVYFWQPWGLIVGVLAGLVGILFTADGIDLSITTPQAFFDFIFPVALLPASLLILAGGVSGLVQYSRHRTSEGNPTVAMAIKGMLGVIGVLMVISAILTIANGDVSAADKEGAVILMAKGAKFEEETLSTSSSGKIVIHNDDIILHTFTIDALDIDVKVGPKSEELYTLKSVPTGDYYYYCRVNGHESMDGKLTVK